jgi:hypothetical protein
MAAYARPKPDNDFAVHHVAVALEHLAKAYLCSLHPALIAASDFDSLLHLVDQGAYATKRAHRVRTIGMAEANQRVRQLLKTAYPYDGNPSSDPVLAARNGVAHAGLWPPEEARRVLALAVRRVDAILAAPVPVPITATMAAQMELPGLGMTDRRCRQRQPDRHGHLCSATTARVSGVATPT